MTRRSAGLCGSLILLVATTVVGQASLPAHRVPRTEESGIVEGRVVYMADAKRPWRYARFYVRDRSRGHLAEAVVALNGKGLKSNPPPTPVQVRVDQKDFRFVPETIAIRIGDSVQFTNSDSQLHNVRTHEGPQSFNVNTPIGGDYTHCFDIAGGIRHPARIGCVFHSQMQAWIFVFAHGYFHVTGEDGTFRFDGVPPGEYELEVVHPAGNLRASRLISVRKGETTTADFSISPDNIVETQP